MKVEVADLFPMVVPQWSFSVRLLFRDSIRSGRSVKALIVCVGFYLGVSGR